MKRFFLLALLPAFSTNAGAQETAQSDYRQQYSIRAGLVNYEVSGDFRLNRHWIWHSDLGYGANYIQPQQGGRYLRTTNPYTNPGGFLGLDWWAFYFNNELRLPFRDETLYLGLKLKAMLPEGFILNNGYAGRDWFLSTYKLGPVAGAVLPFGKTGNWSFEAQLGGALLINHDWTYAESAFVSNARISYRFFRK